MPENSSARTEKTQDPVWSVPEGGPRDLWQGKTVAIMEHAEETLKRAKEAEREWIEARKTKSLESPRRLKLQEAFSLAVEEAEKAQQAAFDACQDQAAREAASEEAIKAWGEQSKPAPPEEKEKAQERWNQAINKVSETHPGLSVRRATHFIAQVWEDRQKASVKPDAVASLTSH